MSKQLSFWGEKLQGVLDKMVKPYPDRFVVFTQMDWSKIDDPHFSAEMVAQLDDAVKRGSRELKVWKDWGLGVKDKSGKLVPIDDPRMHPVWEECGNRGIPVAIHSTDPEAFFTTTDARNERYEELMHNPSWSCYGAAFPAKQELLEQRNHVVAKHPHTTFVALHVANWPENLDTVSDWLRQYPNKYVEFRREASGTGQAALPRSEILRGVSGPHLVRDRFRAGARSVCELLPVARNRRRVFSLLGLSWAGKMDDLRN